MPLSTEHSGNVVQQILADSEEEKQQNQEASSFSLLSGEAPHSPHHKFYFTNI